jgi:hypothetical protein
MEYINPNQQQSYVDFDDFNEEFSFGIFLVENEQVKIQIQHHQFVLNMQLIKLHIIFLIEQIINLNEIFQMEKHVLVHYQIFILNHLIIIHIFGIMMMRIIYMIGVILHIQQKNLIINHQLIYVYQKPYQQQ